METILSKPHRPDFGTIGNSIQLRTNFLPIQSLPSGLIYTYQVTIVPFVSCAKSRHIYQIWENECFESGIFGNVRPVFDGRKLMITSSPLSFDKLSTDKVNPLITSDVLEEKDKEDPSYSFIVDYYEDGDKGFSEGGNHSHPFRLDICPLKSIDMDSLTLFLNGRSVEYPMDAINAIDVILRYKPSVLYTTIGRCFYSPEMAITIAQGAQLWQGFHQSVKPTNGRLMINLDVSATAFHQDGPLLDTVAKILGKSSPIDLRSCFQDKDRLLVERMIKDLKVKVIHRGPFRKKFTILKLTKTSADKTLFLRNNDGEEESVSEYFQRKYQRRLVFGHLPCITCIDGKRTVYLPLEVCKVVPGQRFMRRLNEKQTSDMIKFTCQPPHIRSNKISAGVTILQQKENEYLKDFGLSFSQEMVTVNARVLPAPRISYHPLSKESTLVPREGTWNLKDKKMIHGMSLHSWSVLIFGSERDYPLHMVQQFISTLTSTFEECGVFVLNPKPPMSYASCFGNIQEIMSDAHVVATNSFAQTCQLVLCILPNTGVPLYAEIKRVSDTVLGIPTQCIQGKHIYNVKKQYCANVCLKVNVKLGGMNNILSNPIRLGNSTEPTIVIGCDVTHPAPGSSSSQSIAAMVASMESNLTRYASAIRVQKARQELIEDFCGMLMDLLRSHYQSTSIKPSKIIIYRDGISEGQFYEVGTRELQAIKVACASLDPSYSPKITYIAVHKRHHARFFPIRPEDADKSGNIYPGTVIETGVTHPFEFDFYLASHPGLQGTSKPTHYHVLHDENNVTSDMLQEFTFNMCYLYCRATRSVSVCPPAYYAHLVASRARFHAVGEGWNSDSNKSEDMKSSGGVVSQAIQRGLRGSPSLYFNELGMGKILQYGTVRSELRDSMYFM